jgi:hypothetical protein
MKPKVRWTAPRPQGDIPFPMARESASAGGEPWMRVHRAPAGYVVRFVDLADFEIPSHGDDVTGTAVASVAPERLDDLFHNQVAPLVLALHRRLVIHASVVEVDGAAVAFLGASGSGKSTLAVSFASAGFRFLADDSSVIDFRAGTCWALPGPSWARLWRDDADVKTRFTAGEAMPHCAEARELALLCVLGEGAAQVTIEPLSASAALLALVRQTFLLDPHDARQAAAHFDGVSALARAVPCVRLEFPRREEALEEVRRAVIERVAAMRRAA